MSETETQSRRWQSHYTKLQQDFLDALQDQSIAYAEENHMDHRKLVCWISRRFPTINGIDVKMLHERTGKPGRWPNPKRVMLVRRPRNSKHRQVDKG